MTNGFLAQNQHFQDVISAAFLEKIKSQALPCFNLTKHYVNEVSTKLFIRPELFKKSLFIVQIFTFWWFIRETIILLIF